MDPAVIRHSKCKASCCATSVAPPPPEPLKKPAAPAPPKEVPPPPPQPPKEVLPPPPPQPPKEVVPPKPPMVIVPAPPKEVALPAAPLVDAGCGYHHGRPFHPRAPYPPPVHMRGYWEDLNQLSRIPRLDNVEMTLSRGYRLNFREYPGEFYYDARCHESPPLPAPPPRECNNHHRHHGPPPMECNYHYHHHHRGPPPPPPPPHGYDPYSYFSDENPNGCSVM